MARAASNVKTVLSHDLDRDRVAVVLHAFRRSAYVIRVDCERMLQDLDRLDREGWRERVGEALIASHRLVHIANSVDASEVSPATQRIETLAAQVREPRQRVMDAMSALLPSVPLTKEEDLLLQDVRTIRVAAMDLTTFNTPTPPGTREASVVAQRLPLIAQPRVLVADDDRGVRRVLEDYLVRFGCLVQLAENGAIALESALREPPDLILTDINMPALDGIGLLRELKDSERTRDVPVLVVSSQNDLPSVIKCIELGAEDHIAKPYEPLLLRARVQASLERKRMRDVERDYLRRVGELTAAARAVEQDQYASGSLRSLTVQEDELGRLARVFDRMVFGLKSREERLQRRVERLRHEIAQASAPAAAKPTISRGSPFAAGEILAARYEIIGELGSGGMGMVYHARDQELGDEVAVKVVRRDLISEDPNILNRLKSEIRLARKLSHRNVVRVHDLGESRGTYFITMEYVKGMTVEEIVDRRGRLAIESAIAIGTQVAEALSVAHASHIIHRDIKPANLILDEQGTLKVMDFGIARSTQFHEKLTAGGFIIGTPQYMAPEVLMGAEADHRSDLFAAGVVLYECLSGLPPFVSDSPMMLLSQMSDGAFRPLREATPDVPADLEMLVAELLRFRPEERGVSAAHLATRLYEIEVTLSSGI